MSASIPAKIELMPGVPWASPDELNRLARQQGLCLAIAQASVYDEICQAVTLSQDAEMEAVRTYVAQQEIHNKSDLNNSSKPRVGARPISPISPPKANACNGSRSRCSATT